MKASLRKWSPLLMGVALVAIFALLPEQAHASTAGVGGGLPWEAPITKLVDSMVGPVALGMILLGLVGGVWGFMTGGEINGFVRSMVVMVLAGSILAAAKPFVTSMFTTAALIG
jgi:type IV secretion system protein VirB2